MLLPPAVISIIHKPHEVWKDIFQFPYAAGLLTWDSDDHMTVSQKADPGNDDREVPSHFRYTSKPILKLGIGVEWWEMKHGLSEFQRFILRRKHCVDKRWWERMNSRARLCWMVTLLCIAFRCTKDEKHCQLCSFFFTCIQVPRSNNICNWNGGLFLSICPVHLENHKLDLGCWDFRNRKTQKRLNKNPFKLPFIFILILLHCSVC